MTAAAVVRERPILMSGPMVRAVLDGRKTQTRRVFSVRRELLSSLDHDLLRFDRWQDGYPDGVPRAVFDYDGEPNFMGIPCPYGNVGDRLWVREGWRWFGRIRNPGEVEGGFEYRADGAHRKFTDWPDATARWEDFKAAAIDERYQWRPSIHMPRWASRISLELTDVRVERLQSIALSQNDCAAEGAACGHCLGDNRRGCICPDIYHELWDSLNAKRGYGWDTNPWVWVIGFRTLSDQQGASE